MFVSKRFVSRMSVTHSLFFLTLHGAIDTGTDFGRTEGDDPNRADRDPTASSPASEGSRISSASSEETGGELLAERADGVLVPTTAATIESGHNSPPSFGDRNETNWSPGNDKPAVASGAYCDTRTRGFFVQGKSSLLSAGVRGGPASLATAAMPRTSSRNESEPRPGLTATARFPAFGECFGSLNLEKAFCAQGKPQLGFQHNAFAPAPAFAPTESESPPTAMGAVADASVSGTASTPVSRPATFGKGFSASSAAGFGSFGAARALTSMSGDVVRSSDAACLGTKSAQTFGNTGSFKSYSSVPPVTNTNRGVYGPFSSSSASSIPSQQLRRMNVASKPNYVSAPHTVTDGLSLLKFQSIASAFDDEEISFEEARFKDYGDGNFGTARPGVPFSLSTPASLTAGAGPSLASGTFRGPGRNVLGDAGKGNGGGEVDGGSRNRSLQSERHFFIQLTRNLQTSNRVAVDALARSDRALGDMNNLMGRVNGLQVGYTDLNDNVTFLKEQVDTLGEDDEEIREDVGVLSDNVDSLAIDTNELSSTVAALTDDVGGLESDLEGVRSDMDVLGEDIEEIGGNVNGVRADVSGLRGDILELRQRLLVLEGTLQEHENAAEVGDEGIESGEVNEAHNDLES